MNDQRNGFPTTRREFLQRAGLLGAASASGLLHGCGCSGKGRAETLVGSNAFGWTQYAKRDKRPFDISGTMSALRDCGYDYLEPSVDLARPDGIAELAEQMKARGLKPVSVYCGPRLHEADKVKEAVAQMLAAAKVCRASGFQTVTCNAAPIGREKTDEELRTQVAALKDIGQELKAMGLKLGIHHHLPEMAGNAREFHYNFRNSDPGAVGFCYDVHWVWKGGIQPLDALREYGDRVVSWHIRQSRDGVWLEDLDAGDIDYTAVAASAEERGLPRLFTVELAIEAKTVITRTAVENHRRSREFIRRVFGA